MREGGTIAPELKACKDASGAVSTQELLLEVLRLRRGVKINGCKDEKRFVF